MNRKVREMRRLIAALACLVLLAGCNKAAQSSSSIATVDVVRITANWPKFLNYQNQLQSDMQALESSRSSDADKRRARQALQARYIQAQREVTEEMRTASEQVAKTKNFKLVLTREYVGYGGTDITPDVEKVLNITEKATPKP